MLFDNFMKSDMLSIRKIKLHGMSESRWTTNDKRIQYKGLINLYKRDRKIMFFDKKYAYRRDKDMVFTLKKKLAHCRIEHDNATFGDRQKIRNALAGDRRLQLAYQDLPTEKIIERIHQQNFICRKQLDLLRFEELEKSKALARLKLKAAELEDMIVNVAPGNLPVEIECRRFTAIVQDAILKKEAAIVINEAYKKIIAVCKRDKIYFDILLESLRSDRSKQGKCVLNAIMLGQMAIEYLDDRKSECKRLEAIVQRDMKERQEKLEEVTKFVFGSRKNHKFLIRRDSDSTLPVLDFKQSNCSLTQQLNFVCRLLEKLKESFSANNYSSLMKCLEDQLNQKERLEQQTEKWMTGRDTLQNKIDHSNMMYNNLHHTMLKTTQEYKQRKQYLLKQIHKQEERTKNSLRLHEKKWNMLETIKVSLQNLEQKCKHIQEPVGSRRRRLSVTSEMRKKMSAEDMLNIKANSLEIIHILTPKLMLLSTCTVPLRDIYQRSIAQANMEDLVLGRTKSISTDEEQILESLIQEDITIEDSMLPTRVEMKIKSKHIVQLHAVNEDLIPVFKSKKTRK